PASSLPSAKEEVEFKKKPELGLELIDRSLKRKYRPKIVVIDAGYGNNTPFLKELEKRNLKYLGGLAKNRQVIRENESGIEEEMNLEKLAKSLTQESFTPVSLSVDKPKTLYVYVFSARVADGEGERTFAIVMNASSAEEATDIDYFITNVQAEKVTPQWVVETYFQRNWVEVFYREAKGWLGLREYQVRDRESLLRHFILVFCAYTFILWHRLTGGLQKQWANKPLKTFTDALEAFRTAMSFRFFTWLTQNTKVFASHKAALGYI
ncbi:transposase, partial [Pannus brasiliensis CCIBt3594]